MTTLREKVSDSDQNIKIINNKLSFDGLNLMEVIRNYNTPLRIYYLPHISRNITTARRWFQSSIESHNYKGNYHYCYCTKASHFKFILDRALDVNAHLEISHENDLKILGRYASTGKLDKSKFIICNGHKSSAYTEEMLKIYKQGYNLIPVLDSVEELSAYANADIEQDLNIGIRIATRENFNKSFRTSRLGIEESKVIPLVKDKVLKSSFINLKMLHFFMNTGMQDSDSFWNTLKHCLKMYAKLRQLSPTLNAINLGGGIPIQDDLQSDFNHEEFIDKIIRKIAAYCSEMDVMEPDLFTEFGAFSLQACGITVFRITDQKIQGDEKWNFIDGSILNSLPDSWGLKKNFHLLPINGWERETERVNIGGISCDIDDYYSEDQHNSPIELPKFKKNEPLYIGFFNTAAYQDALSGYGGYQHCLVRNPDILVIDRVDGDYTFQKMNSNTNQLKILGY